MKKIFLYILAGSLCFSACKKDDEIETYKEPEDISIQNSYDDISIEKFLGENYLDAQGNIKAFSATDASDDNETKLKDLNPAPVKLSSGVIYIVRNGAQPNPGTEIKTENVMRIMMRARTYLAANTDGNTAFFNTSDFAGYSSLDGSGTPIVDPAFFYARKVLTDLNPRSYYEIEGFQEAITKFRAFDLDDSANYNLQGVIIVPSRAAFARDNHSSFGVQGTNIYRNKTFVFNFQVYKSRTRLPNEY
ncbi:hypothetical protein ASG01_12325 [Chryseobacterium sp. Leaf180]|uniref:hypothetical protein n=1 Tax=Chryseobacterium sp. Leaf180 TaxID=1736289 RepID=UPI0006FE7750|nr:hypothetical protein [Chryseobacterium sp. Leaf180]KQR92673.1 hypothetical protein ASG01_12325 [Chryseobacterium sp. Leaf180]